MQDIGQWEEDAVSDENDYSDSFWNYTYIVAIIIIWSLTLYNCRLEGNFCDKIPGTTLKVKTASFPFGVY